MRVVLHGYGRRLHLRVSCEVGAHEPAVPVPVVLRIGGGVNTDEAAPAANEFSERALAGRAENVAGRVQKDHDVNGTQAARPEDRAIFGCLDVKAVISPQIPQGLNPDRDGGVAIPVRLREDENGELARVLRRRMGRREQSSEHKHAQAYGCPTALAHGSDVSDGS